MSTPTVLEFLLDLFAKLQVFLIRPSTQIQLIAIALILVVVNFLSGAIIVFLKRRSSKQAESSDDDSDPSAVSGPAWQLGLQQLISPILGLIATNVGISLLSSQGQVVGLLQLLLTIFLIFLGYRFFMGILYTFFPEAEVRRFHTRLFGPLFGLFVIYQILDLFADINTLATVVLTSTVENPLTLGALFIATIGLYFWVDSVSGLNHIIFNLVTKFTSVNEGRLEASLTLGGYILIAIGILISLSFLGVDSTTFAAITAGLSVGVGFALKEILGNFISGIVLLFEGAIRPGDSLKINGARGSVQKLNIRSTLIKMRDNTEVIVPNQELFVSSVTSFTGTDSILRVDTPIWADYDSSAKEVRELLLEIMRNCPLIVPEKGAKVFLVNLDESGMEFKVRFWVDLSQRGPWPVKNYFYLNALEEFAKRDIKTPFPQRKLYFVNEDNGGNEFSSPSPEKSPQPQQHGSLG